MNPKEENTAFLHEILHEIVIQINTNYARVRSLTIKGDSIMIGISHLKLNKWQKPTRRWVLYKDNSIVIGGKQFDLADPKFSIDEVAELLARE